MIQKHIKKSGKRTHRCPGERYTISDSVCRGRQSVNYPKCKVCLEKVEESADVVTIPTETKTTQGIFQKYFIRGKYPTEIDEVTAKKIGNSIALFCKETNTNANVKNIVVGRDMRLSSKQLTNSLIEGLCTAGINVINLGIVSTEMVNFAVSFYQFDGGVMVTASRSPAEYNGFKIFGKQSVPISFETGIERIAKLTMQYQPPRGEHLGKATTKNVFKDYKKHILKFADNLRHLRVVIDAGNGVAGKIIQAVFEGLPIEIVPLYFELDGNFPHHDANPNNMGNLTDLKEKVRETRAHFGVAFDGDADQCVFVDEIGRTIRGDLITALIARKILEKEKRTTILYDLPSSWIVPEEIKAAGGLPRCERVGHPHMKYAMREKKAAFGGESSGHFYFRDNYYSDSGIIALLMILNIISVNRIPFSNIISPLKKYHSSGEINLELKDMKVLSETLAKQFPKAKIHYLDGITAQFNDWWFNIRKSNTEPLLRLNLEGKSHEIVEKGKKALINIIQQQAS